MTGQAQLKVDVSNAGSGKVDFTFTNTGPNAASITDVYFDDGALLGIASITNGAGVSFSQGASPGNLPGGNTISPAFQTTAGFSMDSNPPAQPNGVNPGESLKVTFNLLAGFSFADVINLLNNPPTAPGPSGPDLRIGIHVQGFAGGGSESFVNRPNPVPEPTSVLLLGTVFAGVVHLIRKRYAA